MEIKREAARPQTSTRDLSEVKPRLERWISTQLPIGAAPRISELEVPPSNGMSSETLLFRAEWREEGRSRTEPLVARVAPDPGAVPVFRSYDMDRQFQVIRLVGRHSAVPVPKVFWSEPTGDALGAPFFVMGRVDGRVPPDVMPYNFGSWLSEATAAEQRHLQDASVALLAGLHGIADPERTFAMLNSPRPEPTALGRHVAETWGFYEWVADGEPIPLIERGFAWLREHWPREEGPAVLSWGDARIGNVIYDGFDPVAVLDWEMAALGPRELDIAWIIFLHRFFEDIAAQISLPGMPDFMRRDDVAATYESLTGYTPRDLDFYLLYTALRQAIVMSRIRRRAIHFGEAEPPADLDDLIMHRATLEAMLAGTYWK